ncbi:MAG TPA: BatD family protein [Thermoanaerobaculia bacterium]
MVTARANLLLRAVLGLLFVGVICHCIELRANELIVESRSIGMHDLLAITVSVEGAYAEVDGIDIPLRNLSLVGEPWVSSEFAWINGRVSRRKTFRYRARPLAPGAARVGPVVLRAADGQQETLAAVDVRVMPDRTSPSNDPAIIAQQLEAANRPLFFIVAEADRTEAFVGEQVLITLAVYNAATVQQWQVVETPKMPGFWVEEIDTRGAKPESVYVGDRVMQRIVVRRIAAFPLRSGAYDIGGTTIEAAVMQGSRSGPFSIFEGNLVEITFTSSPISIDVKPLPAGPEVDATGDLSMRCGQPLQQSGGPVVVEVSLTGTGNLRAAKVPRFDAELAGTLEIEGGEVSVSRTDVPVTMSRQWRYLIFPKASGTLQIPPLSMRIFDPVRGERRELRCGTSFVHAAAVDGALKSAAPDGGVPLRRTFRWEWLAAIALLAVAAAVGLPRLARESRLRAEARRIVKGATPAQIRVTLEARLPAPAATLMAEQSDRGDAWRALRSLVDAAERDRDIAVDGEREIERRVREVLRH